MPGLHGQLTSTELTNALAACDTLTALEPYIDKMTHIKISALRAGLAAEHQDRTRASAEARDQARKTTADA
ncbi:MAG: hypothetical protein ABSA53_23095 [Streptosporangiaceae bacterium]|jgi:hypothetical protein